MSISLDLMKSLEVRTAGDQVIEEKIFPKKHFVVCSIITFFLFSLPSIYLSVVHTYIQVILFKQQSFQSGFSYSSGRVVFTVCLQEMGSSMCIAIKWSYFSFMLLEMDGGEKWPFFYYRSMIIPKWFFCFLLFNGFGWVI